MTRRTVTALDGPRSGYIRRPLPTRTPTPAAPSVEASLATIAASVEALAGHVATMAEDLAEIRASLSGLADRLDRLDAEASS